ncbi:MAG: hypothetical protein WA949_16755, partial [Phormidesmis sp.]
MLETWMILTKRAGARLLNALMLFAIALTLASTLWLSLSTVSWAAGYSANQSGSQGNQSFGNQSTEQPANLVSPEPNAKIAIYLRPEEGKNRVGYGIDGDAVTVIEQVSDNQSKLWNHIRFDNPPYAEGWVPESSISLKSVDIQGQQQADGDRYLGNPQINQQLRFDRQ